LASKELRVRRAELALVTPFFLLVEKGEMAAALPRG